MTLKEFFRRIRRGRYWHVNVFGEVRCDDGRCPLGAADDDLKDVPSFRGAARLLGLSVLAANKIANAADHRHSRHRPWLLKELGFEPEDT